MKLKVGDRVRIFRLPTENDKWDDKRNMLQFWDKYYSEDIVGEVYEILEFYSFIDRFVKLDHPERNNFWIPAQCLRKLNE